LDVDQEGWVSHEVVAMMKRTDRDRDWPIVDALGWQMLSRGQPGALVHIQDAAKLVSSWQAADSTTKETAAARRPLLRLLDTEQDPDRVHALIRVERIIWECVDQERYRPFVRAWKEFYRAWRAEEDWQWPTVEAFPLQHARLVAAVSRHGLPVDPVPAAARQAVVERALSRAAVRADTSPARVAQLAPPSEELLP
jgi:hypothetical protein